MAPKRWKSEGATPGLYGGWRRTVHLFCVIASYGFIFVVPKEYFGIVIVMSNSPETILQGFKSLSVQI
jgi:hypothetical protein